jgi:ribonuclease P protein component
MLPAINRLRKTKDIEKVFKNGKGLKEGTLFLKAATNILNFSRFAFVAGQKSSKKATERNRIKRRMREAIRPSLKLIKPGFDIVITALHGSADKNFEELKKSVDILIKKMKLIK